MAKKRLAILVVDDDPADVELLRRRVEGVESWSVDLLEAGSWQQAQQRLESRHIDVVFLDYQLGARTGLEVLADYAEAGYSAPVLMLTGQGNERVAVNALKSGVADYLVKGQLSRDSLVASVEEAMEEANRQREQQHHQRELERMAVTDGLTGLYNRRAFEERLREEVQRTKRYLHSISLLMLDLDHFKRVNDTYGHVVGDEVLLEIARILRANIRSVDIPCRYGGEELCIIVPGTSLAGAETLAERLRRLMAEHEFHTPRGDTFHVTCSVGVSVFNGGADVSADDVINAADEALYCAKEQGRDRVVIRKLA